MAISILCPSRTRVDNLQRLIASVRATECLRSEIIVCVDDDDSAYPPSLDANFDCKIIRGPRICHSDLWNRAAAASTGDILMMLGDDCTFNTPGWDLILEGAYTVCPDKILLTFGNDLNTDNDGHLKATHPTISRKWYEAVGRFTGPWFPGDYADLWLQDIAKALGRYWYLPFTTEHLHHVWHKSTKDQVYKDNEDRRREFDTPKLYEEHKDELLADTEKLRSLMQPFTIPNKLVHPVM